MQKTWLCWLLLTASSTSLADWRPDKINLAFGQFISPLVERKAKIDQYRLSINWELTEALWSSDHVLLQSYMELAFSKWVSKLSDDSRRMGAKSARQASFSPVFRFIGNSATSPFLDVGVGISYQSEADLEQRHPSGINMGGNWQFETRLMFGMNLGATPYALSYGWMHYSNASLASINEGLDFQTLQLTYRF